MPRARKTQSGAPAMAMASIPGQQYGAGVEQQALQKAMPAPKSQTPQVVARAAAQQAAASQGQQPAGGAAPLAQLAAQLKGRVGIMGAPTARPEEPVTQGLSRGLGAGPEVLGMRMKSPLGEMMRAVARQTGDPMLAMLADKANL